MRNIILGILLAPLALSSFGQELSCNVSINTSRLQGTNKQVFVALEESLSDFLNNTVFTNHVFDAHERIECNFLLDITEVASADNYGAKLQVQARRPVFGSTYNTVLFNYIDEDVKFNYQEFDPIDYSENTFISNLSSLFSFYALFIIGMDYDSFSFNGGTPFFLRAEKIVTSAQGSGFAGWEAIDSKDRKNRYWLVDNMLDSEYKPLRQFTYIYHLKGLDKMESSIEAGREKIFEAVKLLDKLYLYRPDPFMSLLQVYVDSKSHEIADIFSEAEDEEKKVVYKIMMKIDPAGGNKYNKIKK